jgi:hypothetical protein
MTFTVEQSSAKREPLGNYTYRIYQDGRFIAHYWHDYRGDEHGIEFIDGTNGPWPVGRMPMTEFIEGGGPKPLTLSQRAVDYLNQRQR